LPLLLCPPGAPLENNCSEQVLKMAVMHRQSRVSDETLNGAQIGDILMGLIHSCRFNRVDRVNSFADRLAMANYPEEMK
jgi:hypothetical protein